MRTHVGGCQFFMRSIGRTGIRMRAHRICNFNLKTIKPITRKLAERTQKLKLINSRTCEQQRRRRQQRLAENANNEQTDTTLNPIKRNKSDIQSAEVQKVNGTERCARGVVRDGPRFGNLSCNFSTFPSADTRISIQSHFNRWTVNIEQYLKTFLAPGPRFEYNFWIFVSFFINKMWNESPEKATFRAVKERPCKFRTKLCARQ